MPDINLPSAPSQSIFTSIGPDHTMKGKKKGCAMALKPRHFFVLSLHLAGKKAWEIKELTGYPEGTVRQILQRDDVLYMRQQLMLQLDKEFEAQYHKVIAAVDSALDATQPATVKLQGAKLWGDYHKRFQKVEVNQTLNITAEDIVLQIMNGNYNPTDNPNPVNR